MKEDERRQIGTIMSKKVITVNKNTDILKIAKTMSDKKISCIVVAERKKPIGIITERDMIRRIIAKNKKPDHLTANDVMTKPVLTVPPESDFIPTGELMKRKKIRRFVVTNDKGEIIGLVTQTDILHGIIKLVKHLDWQLVTMKISVEEYIEKLKESSIL